MASVLEGSLDLNGAKIALIVSRFNELVTSKLLVGAESCLERHGCPAESRTVVRVPGAWELQLAARKLARSGEFDGIVTLGALIRGETPHFDVLATAVARGLAQTGMDFDIPVAFGVLTTENVEQALERAKSNASNKGWEAAMSAIEMVNLYRRLG